LDFSTEEPAIAFWGATAVAGTEGAPRDDAGLRQEFWSWYFNEAVPEALRQTQRERAGGRTA